LAVMQRGSQTTDSLRVGSVAADAGCGEYRFAPVGSPEGSPPPISVIGGEAMGA
jgi:hypothetical protein